MIQAQTHRPADKRRKPKASLPDRSYPAGYFTELIRSSSWHRLLDRTPLDEDTSGLARSQAATAARAAGNAWDRQPLNLPGAIPYMKGWKGGAGA